MLEGTPLSAVSYLPTFRLFSQISVDDNQRVFVYEDDMWTIKGRYERALEDNEDAIWTYENGQDILRFMIVSI